MKRNFQYLVTALLIYLMTCLTASCTDMDNVVVDSDEEAVCNFKLSLNAPISVETRAVNEDKINEIWVVQLASDGTAALVPPVHISPGTDNNIAINLKLQECKIYFFINTGDDALFDTSAALSSFTQSSVEATSLSYSSNWETKLNSSGIPMSGYWEGTPNPATAIPVELTRAIAIVTVDVPTSTIPSGDVFSLSSIQLKNIPGTVQLYRANPTGSTSPAASTSFSDYAVTTATSNTWYMPENARGTGSGRYETEKTAAAVTDGSKATFVEIKGTYNGFAVTYSIYLGENTINNYNVLRNKKYNVTINLKGKNSADARIDVEENRLAWGDILCIDGSQNLYTVKPDKYNSAVNKNAVGVVFYVGQGPDDSPGYYPGKGISSIRGYAVALNNASENDTQWGIYGQLDGLTSGSDTDFQGYNNTIKMKSKNYDVFNKAINYSVSLPSSGNSGWYLPSCGQLRYINDKHSEEISRLILENIIVKAGGQELSNYTYWEYWSSTEQLAQNAYYERMGSGHGGLSKSYKLCVRSVLTF